jgi:hypothetical protein
MCKKYLEQNGYIHAGRAENRNDAYNVERKRKKKNVG